MNFDLHDKLPLCSAEEQWARHDTWAVKKKGQKRAVKVHQSEEDAISHANSNSALAGNCVVEHRKG